MPYLRRSAIRALIPAAAILLPGSAHAHVSTARSVPFAAAAVQDTTFKPEGNYTITVAVAGATMEMSLVIQKAPDGTFAGRFSSPEVGEIVTNTLTVEGRKMTMGFTTPGGPARATLTVSADNVVDGEWTMEGDGSKISGRKTG